MDDYSPRFCMSCGAPLGESETFCTRCGTKCGTATPPAQQQMQYNTGYSPQPATHGLVIVIILSAIWAVAALLSGIVLVVDANSIVANIDPSSLSAFDSLGISPVDFCVILGTIFVVSGVIAAITTVLCVIKRLFIVSLVLCIISAVLVVWMVIGIVGLIVAYLIYRSKHEFISGSRNTL